MATLKVLVALLAALIVVSAVSARTTITTTVVQDDEETKPSRQEGSCEEQVRRQDNFNMCHRFLQERSRGPAYNDLAMVTGGENPQQKGEQIRECCKQMENVREECRCEGLSMMWKQQQHKGQIKQLQDMRRLAENLPAMCELAPQQCQIKTSMF